MIKYFVMRNFRGTCWSIEMLKVVHTNAEGVQRKVRTLGLVQWFLTFFYISYPLSNKITRFTPNTLNGAH